MHTTVFPRLLSRGAAGRAALALGVVAGGSVTARYSLNRKGDDVQNHEMVLPSGYPRACCIAEMASNASWSHSKISSCHESSGTSPSKASCSGHGNGHKSSIDHVRVTLDTIRSQAGTGSGGPGSEDLVNQLRRIVGKDHVYTETDSGQSIYLKGARLGAGKALAVVRPGSLQEAVDALQAVSDAGAVLIPQGANTGLTGGSVPQGRDKYGGRQCVVLNMRRINSIHTLDEDRTRYLCLAGAGIHTLSNIAKEQGRESHSILGSTFLNPTVAAGVAFGSGGTQMRKGPVFTERALWCSIDEEGMVELHDTTGLGLVTSDGQPVSSTNLDTVGVSSDAERYRASICKFNEPRVARFNADTNGIDPVRSEGKVLILASVHDSFPTPKKTETLWVSCDSLELAQRLKQEVCLATEDDLPVACEYMDKDAVDVVDQAGRMLCHCLLRLGIGPSTQKMWDAKLWVESHGGGTLPDFFLHMVNDLLPSVLPSAISKMTQQYDHHLIINVGEFGGGELKRVKNRLNSFLQSESDHGSRSHRVAVHSCEDDREDAAQRVGVFRFAAAPAFRTWCVGRGLQGLSLDYALPKNQIHAPDITINGSNDQSVVRMRYSHFGCNVVHEDIAYPPDVDVHGHKMSIKKNVEIEGGRLPAEHGHGSEYRAPVDTELRWRQMDPTNTMNPGVGLTSTQKFYKE